jgi:hypothetical protein
MKTWALLALWFLKIIFLMTQPHFWIFVTISALKKTWSLTLKFRIPFTRRGFEPVLIEIGQLGSVEYFFVQYEHM